VLEISVAKNFSCSVEQKVLKKFAQRRKSIAQKRELSEKKRCFYQFKKIIDR